MRRIAILGNAGSGKSTLARAIGARLSLPVVHLDVLFWEPGWQESDKALFRDRVQRAIAGDAWVTDGNYLSRTFDLRLPRAELVIWLDTPRLTCACRVIIRSGMARPRPDLPAGCTEGFNADFGVFLAYCWHFDRDVRPQLQDAIQRHAPSVPVIRLRCQREVEAFVAGLPLLQV